MHFYQYNQQRWQCDAVGPSHVIVEAMDSCHANEIAVTHEIYFDGVAKGIDSPSQGDRWNRASELSRYPRPEIYGDPIIFGYGIDQHIEPVKIVYLSDRTKKESEQEMCEYCNQCLYHADLVSEILEQMPVSERQAFVNRFVECLGESMNDSLLAAIKPFATLQW